MIQNTEISANSIDLQKYLYYNITRVKKLTQVYHRKGGQNNERAKEKRQQEANTRKGTSCYRHPKPGQSADRLDQKPDRVRGRGESPDLPYRICYPMLIVNIQSYGEGGNMMQALSIAINTLIIIADIILIIAVVGRWKD